MKIISKGFKRNTPPTIHYKGINIKGILKIKRKKKNRSQEYALMNDNRITGSFVADYLQVSSDPRDQRYSYHDHLGFLSNKMYLELQYPM